MPAEDTVLLPVAVGLTLIGVLVVVLAARRGRRGRVLQGLAVALLPVALYLTGLLRLLWDGVVAVVRWASSRVFDLAAWIGFGALGLVVVLWVVGGLVSRRSPKAPKTRDRKQPAVAAGRGSSKPASTSPPADDDMAEIEALLKSRGIS